MRFRSFEMAQRNTQIKEYFKLCEILPARQSGFRSNYSCVTALFAFEA